MRELVYFMKSCALNGTGTEIVNVECDVSKGMPYITIVGLADVAVKESKERLRAAILNSGYEFPLDRRITINLSPAGTKKEGTHFDLAMALAILICSAGSGSIQTGDFAVIGELSLDGKVKRIPRALPICIGLKQSGIKRIMIPAENMQDVYMVSEVEYYPVRTLAEACEFLRGGVRIRPVMGRIPEVIIAEDRELQEDFSEVIGREGAKRAIEIAVSGFHNIMFSGPPGCGKSMMAKRIPTVMPEMSYDEMLEVTKLYSIHGMEKYGAGLITRRPFRSPGTNISVSAMVGGGSGIPRPGELTLAHCGVLFLDEMPEFKRDVLEALRQPIEDEKVHISRASGKVTYPCRFMLAGARNPCPCGFYGDSEHACTCTAQQIKKYSERISGPIMDRIDIFVNLAKLTGDDYADKSGLVKHWKSSAEMKDVISKAAEVQKERYIKEKIDYNSQLYGRLLKKYCVMSKEAEEMYEMGCDKLKMSRRGADKLLRISRTIADIDGSDKIQMNHVAEAMQFRNRDQVNLA